ncbi:hypothetical protein C367_07032 [Cryptococcus neoformans Ze90-1]|nr:hypothetical protein C367_07032 [Cryptococcus neoformans var. grubii Ze90-1]
MTALSHSLHRDSQQSLPRRASSNNDRGLASGGPHISTASPTASQSTFEDYNLEGEESPNSSETLEKRKKKYSEKLYQWTQEMWNNTRRDIDRRSSVSSEGSADAYKAHNESK